MNFMTLIACGLIAVFCIGGVFSHSFVDTLSQRIALAGGCIGAMGTSWYANAHPLPGPVEVLIWSVAAFAVATGYDRSGKT